MDKASSMRKAEELKLRAVLKKLSDIDIEFGTADFLYRNDEGEKPKSGDYYKRKIKAMEQYAQQVSRDNAINFAGFYYDSVADDPTPKEITQKCYMMNLTKTNSDE